MTDRINIRERGEVEDAATQACYERHRAESCAWSNDYGEDANPEECCYIYRKRCPCAKHYIDCPLHQGADDD